MSLFWIVQKQKHQAKIQLFFLMKANANHFLNVTPILCLGSGTIKTSQLKIYIRRGEFGILLKQR